MTIHVTDEAARQMRRALEEAGMNNGAGVRVAVLPGGCSGFQYGLNLEEGPADDDDVTETADGVTIFTDPFSAQYLDGVTIDYHSNILGSGYVFVNPNASGGCGCGSSFTT
jgi:iron-sulfur cluster assembly accessory protein